VRSLLPWPLVLLAACRTETAEFAAVPGPPPAAAVVSALPAGAPLLVELAPGLGEERNERAALAWCREALAQSAHFDVLEPELRLDGAATLQLTVDLQAHALHAALLTRDGPVTLAGASWAASDLPAAVDQLAWATRLALGERCAAPVPIALATTPVAEAMLATVDAQCLLRDGMFTAAARALAGARERDGGSPFVLETIAAIRLLLGEPEVAERLCREALAYQGRLGPRTQHRLARTLLLAQSSQRPERAQQFDADLNLLGEVAQRERPHDPQCALTRAIACNYRRDFAAARTLLEPLAQRLPNQALPAYHLGWACLGTNAAAAALGWFDAAALRLPPLWLVVPRALARWGAGQHDALRADLERLLADPDLGGGANAHHLRRIQAAHALLLGQTGAAIAVLRLDLEWQAAHPQFLALRAGEFAEQGEVLVRLDQGRELEPLLAAVQAQLPGSPAADAAAYLGGLLQIRAAKQRLPRLEAQLGRGGDSPFGLRLAAFAHELRGELADRHLALARAARLADTTLTKALLAQSLAATGSLNEGRLLRDTLRAEMLAVDLRGRQQHPLLGPELAFAFRLD
jgi:hypothetical protein